ncbi:MAG: hypothetical protein JO079_00960, partial [Frankiaceae bacterium]|nr:hypothetical protein [Frankiaceae bacterium]
VTDVDGYADRTVSIDGVRGQPIGVAAAPGRSLLVTVSDGTLWSESGGWHEVGRGSDAAYAA